LLQLLGAVEHDAYRLTKLGEQLRALPLHPRIGAMLVEAHRLGALREGALWAAIASEPDVLRRGRDSGTEDLVGDSDLGVRADMIRGVMHRPFTFERRRADRVKQVADRLADTAQRALKKTEAPRAADVEQALRRATLAGFVDRLAKRRGRGDDRVLLEDGRGARLSKSRAVEVSPG